MNENCPSCKQPYPFHSSGCSLTPPVAENIRVMSETPDEAARWKEIQAQSDFVARQDGAPTATEQALCGAVLRAKAFEAECASLTARLEEAEKEARRWRNLQTLIAAPERFQDGTYQWTFDSEHGTLTEALDAIAPKPDTGKK